MFMRLATERLYKNAYRKNETICGGINLLKNGISDSTCHLRRKPVLPSVCEVFEVDVRAAPIKMSLQQQTQ